MSLTLKQQAALDFAKIMIEDVLTLRRDGVPIEPGCLKDSYTMAWSMAEAFAQAEPVENLYNPALDVCENCGKHRMWHTKDAEACPEQMTTFKLTPKDS